MQQQQQPFCVPQQAQVPQEYQYAQQQQQPYPQPYPTQPVGMPPYNTFGTPVVGSVAVPVALAHPISSLPFATNGVVDTITDPYCPKLALVIFPIVAGALFAIIPRVFVAQMTGANVPGFFFVFVTVTGAIFACIGLFMLFQKQHSMSFDRSTRRWTHTTRYPLLGALVAPTTTSGAFEQLAGATMIGGSVAGIQRANGAGPLPVAQTRFRTSKYNRSIGQALAAMVTQTYVNELQGYLRTL
eukprot:PhM_4_TR15590/c0_g1_i1/m.23905